MSPTATTSGPSTLVNGPPRPAAWLVPRPLSAEPVSDDVVPALQPARSAITAVQPTRCRKASPAAATPGRRYPTNDLPPDDPTSQDPTGPSSHGVTTPTVPRPTDVSEVLPRAPRGCPTRFRDE